MTIKQLDIGALAEYLLGITEISDLVSDISYGEPFRETIEGFDKPYISLERLPERQEEIYKRARVGFKIMGKDNINNLNDLSAIREKIINNMVGKAISTSSNKIYQTSETTFIREGYIDDDIPYLRFDLRLYFLN